MDLLMTGKALLPGIRFHPTNVELFMYYLKRKVLGKSLRFQMISEVDVFRFAPWDLPSKSNVKTRDLNWYFFCPRSKKYTNGSRSNRSTEDGFWKSTGNDRTVEFNHRPVGKIKTLVFHLGKPPKGQRTDWVMHEYRLEDKVLADEGVQQDAYVICKVYEKSGLGPKNGETYGAPFIEEEWESDDDDNLDTNSGQVLVAGNQRASVITTQNVATASSPSTGPQTGTENADVATVSTSFTGVQLGAVETQPLLSIEADENELQLQELLAMFTDEYDETPSNGAQGILGDDFFDGLEDIANRYHPSPGDSNWSQYLVDNGEFYLELDDIV